MASDGTFGDFLQLEMEIDRNMRRLEQYKRKLKIVMFMAFCFIGFWMNSEKVCAAEEVEILPNGVYMIAEDTILYESPGETQVKELSKDAYVIVLECDDSQWCKVAEGEYEGYVEKSFLAYCTDLEELKEEFDNLEEEFIYMLEEYLEIQRQEKMKRFWGIIIVALVIAIFGVGIFSTLRRNNEHEEHIQKC